MKGGFGFTEGIIWVEQGRYLLLSDIPANVIYKLTPQGKASIYLHRSGYTLPDIWRVGFEQTNGKNPSDPLFEKFYMIGSNGLALDRQGRLIIATWAGRSIDRIEKNGKRAVLADRFEGKQFNGTNDVIVKKNGTIYFTDTYGGLRLRDKDARKGLDFQGVYMIKGGKVTRIIDDIANPNGLALSPDEKILYANGSRDKYVRRYRVLPDDTVTDGEMFIDISGDPTPGITDGLKVDIKGNVWESAAGGVWRVDRLTARQASGYDTDPGARRQRRVRRPRPQDPVYRRAHQRLQDPGEYRGHSVGLSRERPAIGAKIGSGQSYRRSSEGLPDAWCRV